MDKKQKLENLIFDIFDKEIDGADVYHHNGCDWIIFTEEKRWITEFTEKKTLWYNYQHFNELLVYFGMDASESTEYIKKWYEERFIFKPKVENTIQNGVKYTFNFEKKSRWRVENTIQNGVKYTSIAKTNRPLNVENTIQNGVKQTLLIYFLNGSFVENTIQNGVKQTELSKRDFFPEDILQNGVKDTKLGAPDNRDYFIEDTIQNGMKDTINIM